MKRKFNNLALTTITAATLLTPWSSMATSLFPGSVAQSLKASGSEEACPKIQGRWTRSCEKPTLPELAAIASEKEVQITQLGCSVMSMDGELRPIGGMETRSMSLPDAFKKGHRLQVSSSSLAQWDLENKALVAQGNGMVEISGEVISYSFEERLTQVSSEELTQNISYDYQTEEQSGEISCRYYKVK